MAESLAALYAERAAYAYAIEYGGHASFRNHELMVRYDLVQAEIAAQAAQWPALWVRQEEDLCPSPPAS